MLCAIHKLLFLTLCLQSLCLLSPPARDLTRPDFQTSTFNLFTSATSNVSTTTSGAYRNQTYSMPFTVATISTTNRLQCALGITRLYFDFTNTWFGWNVVIMSLSAATASIMVEANGTNIVTAMAVSYLLSSNLLFDIGYVSHTFAVTDDVYLATGNDLNCIGDPIQKCSRTSVTTNYGGAVTKDTGQSPQIRHWCTGIGANTPNNDNIGWRIRNVSPGGTSFTFDVQAIQNTQLGFINFYYVVFQATTITTDVTNVLLYPSVSFGCWMTNEPGCSSSSSTDNADINSAGPVFTPNLLMYGFNMIWCETSGGRTGSFNVSAVALNGDKYKVSLDFVGNSQNRYRMQLHALVFQKISCAGYATDLYMILNRTACNETCNGWIGQYFDSINWCQSCDATCYTCTSTSATCTSCYVTQYRVINGSECDCDPYGYYEDGSLICPACHYSCLSCTSNTNSTCTACNLTVHYRSLAGNSCPCIDGYYDNSLAICAACNYTCFTCSGASGTTCLSCNSTIWFRYLSASSCPCLAGYYNAGVSICGACSYTCLTCTGSTNTTCVTCSTSANRYVSGTSCPCNVGFYDVGPTVMTCSPCHPTCYTCNGPLNTNCLTCDPSANRGFILNRCDCKTHYYNLNNVCEQCDYTCQNCTGGSSVQCSTCVSGNFRTLTSTSCPCNTGYYDGGVAGCLVCHYSCQGCVTSNTNCLACNATNNRIMAGNTCPCADGYVDNLVAACSPCHYSCLTCSSAASTGCVTCLTSQRFLNGASCPCLTHTYDNGVNVTCGTCHYSCLNCTNLYTTSCLSCQSTDRRTLSTNSCPCDPFYYDAGVATCQPCDYQCYTCSGIPSNCTSCSAASFRAIVGSTCVCKAHYYENGVYVCPVCLATCLNCTAFSVCTACDSVTNKRTLSGTNCICMPGFFDNGATVCATCAYQCLTCVTSSTNCLSCNTSAFRTLGSGTCNCNFGYYDAGVTLCALCYYSCDSCTGGLINNCQTCNTTALRGLSGTTCVCPAGYYDDGSSELCKLCFYKCQNCSSFSICTSCDSSLYRTLSLGNCACMNGYYDTGAALCSACHSYCVTCTGDLINNCLICSSAQFRVFSSFQCVCQSGYFESGSATCSQCHYSCLSCSSSWTNCLTCNNTLQRAFSSNTCPCNSGYFDNGGATCVTCDSKCATCVSTATNCLSCNSSQLTVLSGNLCVCQATAYLNSTNGICYACNGYCVTCTSNTNTSCLSCSAALQRTLSGSSCLCNGGYYEAGIPMCGTCHSSCLTCFGGNSQYNCTSCPAGYTLFTSLCMPIITCMNYYFDGQCINSCPNYTYPSANACLKCTNNCYTCSSATLCLTCQTGFKFQPTNNTCVTACNSLQYENNSACYSCPSTCQACIYVNSTVVCTSCNTSYYFYNGACLLTCPSNSTIQLFGMCRPCVNPCSTCFGLSSQQCYSCVSGYTMYGTSCLQQCPTGLFSSSLTGYCELCPGNCTACIEGPTPNSTFCTACTTSLYPSSGVCIPENYFMSEGVYVACHPNCETCTNSSFASCVKCKPLRGDNNQQAIKGYCDCMEGAIDIGQGICDVSLEKTVKTANSFLVSSSASVIGTSLAVGVVTSNFLVFDRFLVYNQLISQYYYLNASVPASSDVLLQSLGMSNIGNFLSNYQESDRISRRLLYGNSTQTTESLFLHRRSSYYIYITSLHIFVATVFVWIMILILPPITKRLELRYDKKPSGCLDRTIKIFKFWTGIFKYKLAIKLLLFTSAQAAFNIAVSLRLTDFSAFTTPRIVNFALTCALALYYIGFLTKLMVVACSTDSFSKKDPFLSLYSDFHASTTVKCYRLTYLPLLILRNLLLQICIVAASSNPFLQSTISGSLQALFLFYTFLCNPFELPYSILVYLTETLLACQLAVMSVMCYMGEDERLRYALILLALNYAQMAVFGVFCLAGALRFAYEMVKQCREKNKVVPEVVSEDENVSEVKEKELERNDSRSQLREEDIPSIADLPEVKIKKRYRVQRRNQVFQD